VINNIHVLGIPKHMPVNNSNRYGYYTTTIVVSNRSDIVYMSHIRKRAKTLKTQNRTGIKA